MFLQLYRSFYDLRGVIFGKYSIEHMAKEQQSWGCEWMDTNKNHQIRKRRGWSTMIFRSMVYLFALNYFYKWDVTHQHTPRYWFELCLMFRFFLITCADWLHNLIDMGWNHQSVIVHLRSKLSRASRSWMFWNMVLELVKSLLDVTISAIVLKKCCASLTGTIKSPNFGQFDLQNPSPNWDDSHPKPRMLVSHWWKIGGKIGGKIGEKPGWSIQNGRLLGDSVPPAPWHPLEGFMAVLFVGEYWVLHGPFPCLCNRKIDHFTC